VRAIVLTEHIWEKVSICIFKERQVDRETDPFVVVRAKEITVSKSEDGKITGKIQDFFKLMGDADYISSPEGINDHYVMCWFDNSVDMSRDLRRLRGVTFSPKVTYTLTESSKRTYNATFEAKYGKLK
jgi:hypothetical protein